MKAPIEHVLIAVWIGLFIITAVTFASQQVWAVLTTVGPTALAVALAANGGPSWKVRRNGSKELN